MQSFLLVRTASGLYSVYSLSAESSAPTARLLTYQQTRPLSPHTGMHIKGKGTEKRMHVGLC